MKTKLSINVIRIKRLHIKICNLLSLSDETKSLVDSE